MTDRPLADVLAEGDDLDDRELAAIGSLQRLAKRWPRSLTLASMGGSLVVVRTNDARFTDGGAAPERSAAAVAYVEGIPNTGGDW
jgi:hypothetical protein